MNPAFFPCPPAGRPSRMGHALPLTQRGVGLIEVLVTVLVLGIGLLGLASLQTQSLRYSVDAYYRTQATVLATDITDRMRANLNQARRTNNYLIATTEQPTGATVDQCVTGTCTAASLAAFDVMNWRREVAATLPDGRGAITAQDISPEGWRAYTVTLEFDASRGDGTGLSTFTYDTRL